MSKELTLPTGRMLWANDKGDLFAPVTTDYDGNPLVYKEGLNKGKPRVNFRLGYAIAKTIGAQAVVIVAPNLAAQGHTLQTLLAQAGWTLALLQQQGHVTVLPAWTGEPWGMDFYNEASAKFRNGETLRPDFSWKIVDGDSAIVGKGFRGKPGTAPNTKEGHPGHWVLTLSSDFAPNLYLQGTDGKWHATDRKDVVKCGHFIQATVKIEPNTGASPGLYVNHTMIAYRAWGPEIVGNRDPNAAGFGQDALPAGASVIPQGTPALPVAGPTLPPFAGVPPVVATNLPPPTGLPVSGTMTSPSSLPPPTTVVPHTGILTLPPGPGAVGVPGTAPPPPPPPAGPQLSVAARAAGYTIEGFTKAGWTLDQMRAAGHIA